MEEFEVFPKKWGNSIGIIIPKEIVRRKDLSSKKKIKVMLIEDKSSELDKIFGTLKIKKPTQQIMNEIDEGYD